MIDKGGRSTGVLRVDLDALASNYLLFKNMAGNNCEVAGIVKADAYGLGMIPVFNTLKNLGCGSFFVATPDEALELRSFDSDVKIYVLGGLFKGAEREYIAHNIVPVLSSMEEILRWNEFAKREGKRFSAVIHFDTGMNRLGLGSDEAERLFGDFSVIDGLDVHMVISHFACADEAENPMTERQHDAFLQIAGHFPKAVRSLANSSGLFRNEKFRFDAVRPGYALYGGNPTPEATNPVKNVVSLDVKVLQIRNVKKGESVGYGARHVFDSDTVVATLGCGYADGLMRSGIGRVKFYRNGVACPVVGRISMDLVGVDIGHLSGDVPDIGDLMELLGENQGVDKLAESLGTIGYEVLTSLGSRYVRVYE